MTIASVSKKRDLFCYILLYNILISGRSLPVCLNTVCGVLRFVFTNIVLWGPECSEPTYMYTFISENAKTENLNQFLADIRYMVSDTGELV